MGFGLRLCIVLPDGNGVIFRESCKRNRKKEMKVVKNTDSWKRRREIRDNDLISTREIFRG